MRRLLLTVLLIGVVSRVSRGQVPQSPASEALFPCRCAVHPQPPVEGTIQTILEYHPEAFHGQGGVISDSAPHEDPWFQLLRVNRTRETLRKVEMDGRKGGTLAIYRHVKRHGKLFDELIQTLRSPKDLSRMTRDVPVGGLVQFINFPWPGGCKMPAGDYVARMLEPYPGFEVRVTLLDIATRGLGKPISLPRPGEQAPRPREGSPDRELSR